MSMHLLKILLSELATVRVVCTPCGHISELPIDKLGVLYSCPICKESFENINANTRPLADLARAAKAIMLMKERFEVEFVIPAR